MQHAWKQVGSNHWTLSADEPEASAGQSELVWCDSNEAIHELSTRARVFWTLAEGGTNLVSDVISKKGIANFSQLREPIYCGGILDLFAASVRSEDRHVDEERRMFLSMNALAHFRNMFHGEANLFTTLQGK